MIQNALAQLGGNPDIPVGDHPMVQRAQAVLDQKQIDLNDTVIPGAGKRSIVTKVEHCRSATT